MNLLMIVFNYDRDPFVVGGRENQDAILVHVPHEPSPVIAFITAAVTCLNSIKA
jgi:hypothetical protein